MEIYKSINFSARRWWRSFPHGCHNYTRRLFCRRGRAVVIVCTERRCRGSHKAIKCEKTLQKTLVIILLGIGFYKMIAKNIIKISLTNLFIKFYPILKKKFFPTNSFEILVFLKIFFRKLFNQSNFNKKSRKFS